MNRRRVLRDMAGAGAIGLAATTVHPNLAAATNPATFVLVHGAWHGGWCWSRLRPLLEAAGHRVTTPTLTGLGERRHLIGRAVNFDTHVQDVINHIDMEELSNVVLVGHSHGGFVVCGVVERHAQAIGQLVILDGFVPRDGEAVIDYAAPQSLRTYRENAAGDEAWNIPPLPAAFFGIPDKTDAAWVDGKLTPQPIGPYLQKIRIEMGVGQVAKKGYIACAKPALPVLESTKERIRQDAAWRFVELQDGHDVMVTSPRLLADTLTQLL